MKSGSTRFWTSVVSALLVLVLVGVLIPLSSEIKGSYDLTSDNRFTLPPEALTIAESIDDEFLVTVYLSDPMPSRIRHLHGSIFSRLQEFRDATDQLFQFEFVNPDEWPEDDERRRDLNERGIQPLPLRDLQEGKVVAGSYWLSMEFRYRDQEEVLPLASLGQLLLEETEVLRVMPFVICSRIKKLTSPDVGLGISAKKTPAGRDPQDPNKPRESDGIERFRQNLAGTIPNIVDLNIAEGASVPDNIDAILVHRPEDFDKKAMKVIDQFLLRGGKVVVFLDNLEIVDVYQRPTDWQAAFARDNGQLRVRPIGHGEFDDWLAKYGIKVGDGFLESATPDRVPKAGFEVVPDPRTGRNMRVLKQYVQEHPSLFAMSERNSDGDETGDFNSDSPILAGLGRVAMLAPVPMELTRGAEATSLTDKSTVETLLQSPEDTFVQTLDEGRMTIFRREGEGKVPEKSSWKRFPLMVSVRGMFKSAYAPENSAPADPPGEEGENPDSGPKPDDGIELSYSSAPGHLIVVADSDFASDQAIAVVPNNPQLRGASLGSQVGATQLMGLQGGLVKALDALLLGDELVAMRRPRLASRLIDAEKVEEDKAWIRRAAVGAPAFILVLFGICAWIFRSLTTRVTSHGQFKTQPAVAGGNSEEQS